MAAYIAPQLFHDAYGGGPGGPNAAFGSGHGGRTEGGKGYVPVDPFKPSLALGLRKMFGKGRDRTIDEVPVGGPPHQAPGLASAMPMFHDRAYPEPPRVYPIYEPPLHGRHTTPYEPTYHPFSPPERLPESWYQPPRKGEGMYEREQRKRSTTRQGVSSSWYRPTSVERGRPRARSSHHSDARYSPRRNSPDYRRAMPSRRRDESRKSSPERRQARYRQSRSRSRHSPVARYRYSRSRSRSPPRPIPVIPPREIKFQATMPQTFTSPLPVVSRSRSRSPRRASTPRPPQPVTITTRHRSRSRSASNSRERPTYRLPPRIPPLMMQPTVITQPPPMMPIVPTMLPQLPPPTVVVPPMMPMVPTMSAHPAPLKIVPPIISPMTQRPQILSRPDSPSSQGSERSGRSGRKLPVHSEPAPPSSQPQVINSGPSPVIMVPPSAVPIARPMGMEPLSLPPMHNPVYPVIAGSHRSRSRSRNRSRSRSRPRSRTPRSHPLVIVPGPPALPLPPIYPPSHERPPTIVQLSDSGSGVFDRRTRRGSVQSRMIPPALGASGPGRADSPGSPLPPDDSISMEASSYSISSSVTQPKAGYSLPQRPFDLLPPRHSKVETLPENFVPTPPSSVSEPLTARRAPLPGDLPPPLHPTQHSPHHYDSRLLMTPPSIHKQARQEGHETFYVHPQDKVDSDEILALQVTWYAIAVTLFLEVVPQQVYLHFLLRFPALYFSRVTRIFQDANLGMGEIKRMALEAVELDKEEGLNRMLLYQGVFPQEWHGGSDGKTSASYMNLRTSWQAFIDSLMREWKTLNIISVLLLSAILTILQIESAAANPLTRFSALLSLVCAFMSLIYGCLYIIRFGTMRKTHKAAEWANESERTSTSIFWNVWVMLAMPAVWLGWSMIFYIICIMSFVWQTGTVGELRESLPTDLDILIPRILISCVLGLGVVYLVLVGATFRRYSDPMEQAWQERIRGWLAEKAHVAAGHYYGQGRHDGRNYGDNGQAYYKEGVPKTDAFADGKSFLKTEKTHIPHPSPPWPGRKPIVPLTKSLSPDGGAVAKSLARAHLKASNPDPQQKSKSLFSAGTFLAMEQNMETQNDVVRGGRLTNPFVSFMTAPRILDQPLVAPAGYRSSSPSSRPSRTDNLGRTELHSGSVAEVAVPSGLRYGTSVGPLTQGDTLNEEHLHIKTSTGGIEESTPFSHRVVSVIAVPLEDAPIVDGKAPVLEEMREVFRFESKDAKSAQGTPGSLGQEGIETIEPTNKTATTSTIPENIPIPRELLEKGLASPTWYDLWGEISTAWAEVRDNKERGLEEMVETVDAWNGYLDPFNMFLALIQMEDIARQDEQPSSDASRTYSLFLGSKEVTRVGVRAIDKEGNVVRVSRLTLRGEGDQTEAREYGIPDILRIVGQYDGVLRFSDDGQDRDGECLTRDGQTESENSDMVS